ncbi:hypothetical protein C7M84_020976 [Penaeus vannamei]|uniref:Cuticle protein 6 n=1 Tax=Penaeus vannamei TaxID=6689 RepID=A0A3R7MLV0_PENVA|nr:hypothetical protein C7M84_020976 [Penaeus vannamei]
MEAITAFLALSLRRVFWFGALRIRRWPSRSCSSLPQNTCNQDLGSYTYLLQRAPAPVSYNVAPVYPPVQSQYHAQDEIGQYSFGYAGGPSSRAESRDAFGVVRGSYNYVDSEGKVQTQHYVADALGFRASGTNLPGSRRPSGRPPGPVPEPVQDTAEVVAAKLAHFQAYNEAAAAAAAAPDTR